MCTIFTSDSEHHLFKLAGCLVRAGHMVAVTVGGATVVVAGAMTAAARSLASVVWSSALRARAAFKWSRISSILTWSSSSSLSLEGLEDLTEEDEAGRWTGPPFSHILANKLPALEAELAWPPSDMSRGRSRRVLRVSRLKWTLLLSLGSCATLALSLFHLEKDPRGAGWGGGWGWAFWMLQLGRQEPRWDLVKGMDHPKMKTLSLFIEFSYNILFCYFKVK